jgi:hypothetical protein
MMDARLHNSGGENESNGCALEKEWILMITVCVLVVESPRINDNSLSISVVDKL